MAYNSTSEALKKLRAKKMSMNDYLTQDEIEEGTDQLSDDVKKATDLAPSIKKDEEEKPHLEIEIEMENPEEEENEVPPHDMQMQMAMQKKGLDQGDAVLPKGMYEEGDENKKGFMGKAARKMLHAMKK